MRIGSILHRSSSQVKALWYPTSTQSFDKICYLKVGLDDARDIRLLLSANQSERSLNLSSVDIHFSLSISTKNMFFNAMRDWLWLVPYDACGTNQLEYQLLITTFVKGLCRVTISLYLALWRCAAVYSNKLLTSSSCWRGEGLGVRLAAGMIMNVMFPLILACKVTKNTCCWRMYEYLVWIPVCYINQELGIH